MRSLEKHAIELALTFGIAPKTFWPYVDDSHAQLGGRNNAVEFLNVLNSQDLQIQYNTEYENDNKELNFSDVNHLNKLNHFHDFAECRKTLTTSVQIKSQCKICPNITLKVFRGVLLRALYIY